MKASNPFSDTQMQRVLSAMLTPNETYYSPLYVGYGNSRRLTGTAMNNRYGFVAITNQQRFLVTQFNMFGELLEQFSFPLQSICGLKIHKIPLTSMHSIRIKFRLEDRVKELRVKVSEKVHLSDLKYQEENIEQLISALEMWS